MADLTLLDVLLLLLKLALLLIGGSIILGIAIGILVSAWRHAWTRKLK